MHGYAIGQTHRHVGSSSGPETSSRSCEREGARSGRMAETRRVKRAEAGAVDAEMSCGKGEDSRRTSSAWAFLIGAHEASREAITRALVARSRRVRVEVAAPPDGAYREDGKCFRPVSACAESHRDSLAGCISAH